MRPSGPRVAPLTRFSDSKSVSTRPLCGPPTMRRLIWATVLIWATCLVPLREPGSTSLYGFVTKMRHGASSPPAPEAKAAAGVAPCSRKTAPSCAPSGGAELPSTCSPLKISKTGGAG
eukprot:scaffold84137_cov63-Phaeocystis_antarctica.AAC.1